MIFSNKMFNAGVYSINAAALILGAAGLLSRLLGVVRDRLLAAHFGAGRELDIYYAAFQIPDFVSVLFILGAGSAAILPVFQEYLSRDRNEAQHLISELVSNFIIGAAMFCLFAVVLAPFLISLLVPGFSLEEQALTVALTRIMLLSPFLLGLSAIFSSVVESHQRFFTYAAAPLLYNIGIIAGIVFFMPQMGLSGLALGVVAGATFHAGINFFTVRSLGFAPRFIVQKISAGVRKISSLALPRVLSISLSQLTTTTLIFIGSSLASGSIAVFQLALNLYALPIGVFGVSYGVALFPQLSRAYIGKRPDEFFGKFFLGIRTILFWTLPVAALFVVLRAHIVRVALGAGAFSWEDTRLTAAVLAVLAAAMAAGALHTLLIRSFYALENTRTPFFINMGASILSVGLAFFFSSFLGAFTPLRMWVASSLRISDLPHPEVIGLALGFSIGMLANIFFLYHALRRLLRNHFGTCPPFPAGPVGKILIASLLGAATAYGVRISFSGAVPLITFFAVWVQGVSAGVAGAIVYFGTLFLMGEEEVFALWQTIRRNVFRVRALPQSWDDEMHPS